MLRGFVTCLAVLTAAAPAAAQSLVGDWRCAASEPDISVDMKASYRPNGRLQKLVVLNGYFDERPLAVHMDMQGRWARGGTALFERLTSVRVRRMFVQGVDATRDPRLGFLRSTIESIPDGDQYPVRIAFDGPDRFRSDTSWGQSVCVRLTGG